MDRPNVPVWVFVFGLVALSNRSQGQVPTATPAEQTAATTALPAEAASSPPAVPAVPPAAQVPHAPASSAPPSALPAAASPSLVTAPRFPESPRERRGIHEHDRFFLRLAWGGSYMQNTSDQLELRVRGPALEMSVAIGGAVGKGFVVFADLFWSYLYLPTVTGDASAGINDEDGGAGYFGIGPGLAYYLAPSNVFFSFSMGFAAPYVVDSGLNYADDVGRRGVIANLMIGKEWWVSEQWGLGLAGRCNLGTAQFDDNVRWRLWTLGLAVTATYN